MLQDGLKLGTQTGHPAREPGIHQSTCEGSGHPGQPQHRQGRGCQQLLSSAGRNTPDTGTGRQVADTELTGASPHTSPPFCLFHVSPGSPTKSGHIHQTPESIVTIHKKQGKWNWCQRAEGGKNKIQFKNRSVRLGEGLAANSIQFTSSNSNSHHMYFKELDYLSRD